MTQEAVPDFIVIDDDSINNTICNKIIKLSIPKAIVQTFTSPEEGLEFILNTYQTTHIKTILLLDINMPTLTGWEVLEKFQEFPDWVKGQIKIFILSSSVDPQDKEKAQSNPLVSGYIVKPLTGVKLHDIFEDYHGHHH